MIVNGMISIALMSNRDLLINKCGESPLVTKVIHPIRTRPKHNSASD